MERLILFVILSLPIIYLSWQTIFNIKSHGFYRFFSWECILWLLVSNYKYWFVNALCTKQIFSWIFLFFAAYLIIAGVILLKKKGKPVSNRDEKELYQFEKTSELIDDGIFKYIRHPLYSSLLFLTWGIFLKNTANLLLIVSVTSSIFLFLTALSDEKECIKYFGDQYNRYMNRTKRFIPFVF
jgi:protein-S-isoprenylcysteine O-methyltransferase Ste14